MTLAIETLSVTESSELAKHEAVIERGLQTFCEVGTALLAIRDGRLYRESHETFEEYCQERWQLDRVYAYRIMNAAEVAANLLPMGNIPINERQARPLTTLEPEAQRIVWEVVQKTAPAGKVTAAHVQSVANVFKDVVTTGAIDNGTGEQIQVADVVKAAITEETYERMQRQDNHIRERLEEKNRRRVEKVTRQNTIPTDLPDTDGRYSLLTGDINDVLPTLPDAAFDAIITDPPYPREYLALYEVLAREGARLLKPGGIMAVMCGQSYLPQIMALMTLHLEYHWTYAYLTPGGQAVQIWPRKVNTFWKPVLTFTNGAYAGEWTGDVLKSDPNDNDKRFHEWGQSESGIADMMTRFTLPGQRILDPFLGGGTTAVVALRMNRIVTGVDCDPQAIETTKARIAEWISQ